MPLIKKDDTVKVLSGKDKGRTGKVLKVFREKATALVERLNYVKKHTRAGGKAGKQGGIIEKEAPLRLAKLMLVCPKCSKASRIGMRDIEGGDRVRYCKKCGEQIDN
ncbi:MAG: 50S ribosomal protein L24 [Thermodesulfobacteriota bacterium]